MSFLKQIQTRGEITTPGQVMEYLRQLEDQVRYALANLDGENIQVGAIGDDQLNAQVKGTIRTAQSTADKSGKDAEKARKAAEKNAARIGALNSGLNALMAQVAALDARAVSRETGSGGFKLYLGAEQPEARGIVWIRPGDTADPDGSFPCEVKFIPDHS